MSTIASQITGVSIVYSTVFSGADQRKHPNSASLASVRRIHRWPVIPHTKGQQRGKCFDLMTSSLFLLPIGFMIHIHALVSYRKTSNISRTLQGNKIVHHSDVVGASPAGAAPTTSSISTLYLTSMDWAKATAKRDKKHLKFASWCVLYYRFDGNSFSNRTIVSTSNNRLIARYSRHVLIRFICTYRQLMAIGYPRFCQ